MSIKIPPEKKAWFDAQRAELRELLAKEKKPVACVTPTAVYFSGLCCTNRVYRLLGDRFVTNEPEDAEAASEAVPNEELEGV